MLTLQPATAVTIAAAICFGMALSLLGSLKLALAKRLDVAEGRVGTLLALLYFSLIPLTLLTGLAVDRFGVTPVLITGSLALAMALYGLGLQPTFARTVAALMVGGFGAAGISTAAIVLMPHAFFAQTEHAASLNLGSAFIALGALLTPPLVATLLERFGWRKTLGTLAVLNLAPAILAALAGQQLAALHPVSRSGEAVFSLPAVWLAGLVSFFYAPLEGAIAVWGVTYLRESAIDERRAARLLSTFWAAFVVSRLVVALAQHAGHLSAAWDTWLLVVPAALTAAVLGNLVSAARPSHVRLGMFTLGFLLGPLMPTLLGLLFRTLHEHGVTADGAAYGCTFALGSFGSLLLAPAISAAARRGHAQAALRLPLFLALALTAATVVFWLAARGDLPG